MAENTPGNSGIWKNSGLLSAARIFFLVAVAVVIYLLARSCGESRSQLESTRTTMTRERDSLIAEFNKTRDRIAVLLAEKDTLTGALERGNRQNARLANDKAEGLRQLAKSKSLAEDQSYRISTLENNKDSLTSALGDLQVRMNELAGKITGMEKEITYRDNNIAGLNDSLKEKDRELNTTVQQFTEQHITDSLKTVPHFVLGGDLAGGLGMGSTNIPFSKNFAGGSIVAGMEYNRRFFAGIGTGAYVFNGGTLMPIFLEFRYGFNAEKWTPYIFSKGGPLFNYSSNNLSNMYYSAGIGMRRQVRENFAFNFGTGLLSHNSGSTGRSSFLIANVGILYTPVRKKGSEH